MSAQGKEAGNRTSRGMSIKEMEGRVSAVLLGWWNVSREHYKQCVENIEAAKKAGEKVTREPLPPTLSVTWEVFEWTPSGILASARIAGTFVHVDGDRVQNTIAEIASSAVAIAVGDARGHAEPHTYIFSTTSGCGSWNNPMITRTTLLVDVEKL